MGYKQQRAGAPLARVRLLLADHERSCSTPPTPSTVKSTDPPHERCSSTPEAVTATRLLLPGESGSLRADRRSPLAAASKPGGGVCVVRPRLLLSELGRSLVTTTPLATAPRASATRTVNAAGGHEIRLVVGHAKRAGNHRARVPRHNNPQLDDGAAT